MTTSQNYLRLYRKRTPLTQSDIAHLVRLQDYSNISRYEKGQRAPKIELLLVYQHLFDASIESFFEHQSAAILSILPERIDNLIKDLRKEDNISKCASRITFLEETLIRLAN